MKTTFLTLALLIFGFSSFAFMPSLPAENTSKSEKNIVVSSEKPKTESENKTKTKETKTVTAKQLAQKMEANYAANKKEMSLKERIANKLLIKQLKKAEKKQIKGVKDTKIDSGIALLFRIIGIVFIIVGAVAIIEGGLIYGVVLIALGILAISLPSII
jgi:cobalamin biosynthesis Mg chelatase CobN